MPIKSKPIDPDRARLAARGQWLQRGLPVTHAHSSVAGNTRGDIRANRGSSSSSSSTSSSGTSDTAQKVHRARRGTRVGGTGKKDNNTAAAFITATQAISSGTEASNSDPELYRLARERTTRFLYPNGRPVGATKTAAIGDDGNAGDKASLLREGSKVGGKDEKRSKFASPQTREMEMMTRARRKTARRQCLLPSSNQEYETQVERWKCSGSGSNSSARGGDDGETFAARPVPPVALPTASDGSGNIADTVPEHDCFCLLEPSAEVTKGAGRLSIDVDSKSATLNAAVESMSVEGPAGERVDVQERDEKQEEKQYPRSGARAYVRPPRTFEDLQERALLQLYATHQGGEEVEGSTEGKGGSSTYFIATEHMAEAFTLATLEAAREDSLLRCHTDSEELYAPHDGVIQPHGAPLSLLGIVAAERARRNALSALHRQQEEGDTFSGDHNSGLFLCADAAILATNAEKSLNRFLSAVRCIESAVRDWRVMEKLGGFLFQHHKHFLHVGTGSSGAGLAIREYPHEAFAAYEQYSRYLDSFLIQLLNRHVPHFSAEEFILALYDVNYDDRKDEAIEGRPTTLDILSYPAWRLLQSISSFDEFCSFMDDFIAEEYGVEDVTGHHHHHHEHVTNGESVDNHNDCHGVKTVCSSSDKVVVAAGARGIRALLAKTTIRNTKPDARERSEFPVDGDTPVFRPSRAGLAAVVSTHQQPETSLHVEGQSSGRAGSTPALTGSSNSAPHPSCLVSFQAPLSPPPSSALSSSRQSSHNSISSFPKGQRGRQRRIDALMGRNLPPLSVTDVGDKGRDDAMHSMPHPGPASKMKDTHPLTNGPSTVPTTRCRSERKAVPGKEARCLSRPRLTPPSGNSRDKKCRDDSVASRSGTWKGSSAGPTTTSARVCEKRPKPR